jgi:lambda family phage tail tape measure protein
MADNTFITRMVIESVGLDAYITQMRAAGKTQQEIKQFEKEYAAARKESARAQAAEARAAEDAANKAVVAIKGRNAAQEELNNALRSGRDLGRGTSFAQMLGQDINTSQFAKYQSEVSRVTKQMRDATSPAEIQAYETRLSSIAQKYGQINVEVARLAGISRETFVKGISAEQYVAISNAVQKLKEQAIAASPAVAAVFDRPESAIKKFADLIRQTETPMESLQRKMRELSAMSTYIRSTDEATAYTRAIRSTSEAIQKLRADQAGVVATSATDKLTEAQKRFEQIVQQTLTPVEKLKQQLRDLQTFKSNLPDEFKATDQQAQALHRRFVDLNAQLRELNKPVDAKAPFQALMRQYDPQFAVQQRDARSAQIMAGVGAGAYDLATAERMNKALMAQAGHLNEVSIKGRYSTNQLVQFTAAARNTAESLASGMSASTVAMTQGMQILGAVVGENIGLMIGLGAAVLALSPVIIGLMRAMDVEARTRQFESSIRVMGRSSDETAGQMFKLSEAMREMGASRGESLDAVQALMKVAGLDTTNLERAAKLSVDFSAAFGGDVAKSSEKLVSLLNNVSGAADEVAKTYRGSMSPATQQLIKDLDAQGRSSDAAGLLLDSLTKRFAGEHSRSISTLQKDMHGLSESWNDFADSIANTGAISAASSTLNGLADAMNLVAMAANAMSNDPMKNIKGLEMQLERENKVLAGQPSGKLLDSTQLRIAKLSKELADLRSSNGISIPTSTAGGAGGGSAAASGSSFDITRLAALRTSLDQTAESERGLRNSIGLVVEAFDKKAIGLDEYIDKLSKLSAQLANVMTPLERVQQTLGDEKSIAALPQSQRASARARMSAFRAAADRPTAGQEGDIAFQTAEVQRFAAVGDAANALSRQVKAERELAAAALSGAKAMSIARAEAAYREAEAQGQNKTLAYTASLEKDRSAAMQQLNTELQAAAVVEETAARAKQVGLDQATVEMKVKYGLIESAEKYIKLQALQAQAQRRLNEENQRSVAVQLDMLSAENDNLSASERAYQQAVRLAKAREAAGVIDVTRRDIEVGNAADQRRLSNAQYAADLRKQMNPELVRSNAIADLQASGASGADYTTKLEEIRKTYEQNVIARKELETDWASGAERAWLKYGQSVGTVADQTERVMTNAFKTMEDAMVEFAMTGELSVEKMINSIIADLVRMQIQMSIMIPLKNAMQEMGGFGGMFSGLFGGSEPPMPSAAPVGQVTMTPLANAHGNVFPFAKGGVVNGLTPFRFGQGGAMSGIMGEAGPEAIVPLTRTPQGDLGIRSSGGGAQVKVEVIDQRGAGAAPIDVETQMGAFGPIVRIIARDEANKAVAGYAKGGGLTNQLRQDYNLRQPAVNRG